MPTHYNLEHEKQFLSAVIRNPSILADCPAINEKDFSHTNRVVFQMIQSCLSSVGVTGFSRFVLIERLNSLNLLIADTIQPALYINALELIGINDKAAIEVGRQLKKWTIHRELDAVGQQIKDAVKVVGEKKATELVAEVTGIFNAKVNLLGGTESDPIDLYGTIQDFIHQENEFTGKSIVPPWDLFTDFYGYFDAGTAPHLFCSRMKIGKSSLWLTMALELAKQDLDDSLRILVLDTELSVGENHSRSLAQVSGVKEFRIRQGFYRQNKEEKRAVEQAADMLAPLRGRVSHEFCGGREMPDIISTARRWAFKTLKAGKRGLIVYDYIKLSGASEWSGKVPLFIQMGAKMEMIKNLGKELMVPTVAFCQTNRENVDSKGGDRQQNSAVIGGSDMLAQFASNVYLLEELPPEERAWLGQLSPDSATHSLRDIACRQLGENRLGESRLVKYETTQGGKSKYCKNHILFNFSNFYAKEVGTFRAAVDRMKVTAINVQPEAAALPQGEKML